MVDWLMVSSGRCSLYCFFTSEIPFDVVFLQNASSLSDKCIINVFFPSQVITRINYGQSTHISGLAGAVSLAGSESGLWAVEGGNWQLAAGLLKTSNATLHLQEGIDSITDAGDYYVLRSNTGSEYNCTVTVVATPLNEVNITFSPPISIPLRKMQHTHATFVRGLLNPVSVMVAYLSIAIPFIDPSINMQQNERVASN